MNDVLLLILLIGIVLTGSRIIYVLTAFMLIYVVKDNPGYIKKILVFAGALVAMIVIVNVFKLDI